MSSTQERVKRAVAAGTVLVLLLLVAMEGTPQHGESAAGGAPARTPSGIEGPIPAGDSSREGLDRLAEEELKAFYVRCSGQSIERRLDGGEAMACSIGYDVLLKKYFGGDFERLLAWSRAAGTASPRGRAGV